MFRILTKPFLSRNSFKFRNGDSLNKCQIYCIQIIISFTGSVDEDLKAYLEISNNFYDEWDPLTESLADQIPAEICANRYLLNSTCFSYFYCSYMLSHYVSR